MSKHKFFRDQIQKTARASRLAADAATHEELSRKVNEKLNGDELYGLPFFSEEMMYQAMPRTISPH